MARQAVEDVRDQEEEYARGAVQGEDQGNCGKEEIEQEFVNQNGCNSQLVTILSACALLAP